MTKIINIIKYLFKFFCEKETGKPSNSRLIITSVFLVGVFFINKLINKGFADQAVDMFYGLIFLAGMLTGKIALDSVNFTNIIKRKKK
jgi:hypothetical protein